MVRRFFEARMAVATSLAAICAGIVLSCVLTGHAPPRAELIALAAEFAISFIAALLYLRHLAFALAVVTAPFAGAIVVASLLHGATALTLILAWLTGFSLALFLAGEIAARVVDGAGVPLAVVATLEHNLVAALAAIGLAVILPALLPLLGSGLRLPVAAACAELACGAGTLIVLPLLLALLPFGEESVARTNRLRESSERVFEKAVAATEPRWGWSISGIAVVFVVLVFFGAKTLKVDPVFLHSVMRIPAAAVALVAVLIASAAAGRDWRRMVGATGALLLVDFIGAWGYARADVAVTGPTWLALLQILGIAAVPILLMANAARPEAGEDVSVALARAILGKSGAAVASLLTAVVVLLVLSLALRGEGIALAIAMLFALPGAILVQTAIATLAESLIPRRSTIEARYRVN